MPTSPTLYPNGTGTNTGWSVTGSSAHAALADLSDSTYIECTAPTTTNKCLLLFDDTPSDLVTVDFVSITFRSQADSSKDSPFVTLQLVESNETTAMTAVSSHFAISEFTGDQEYHNATITGTNTKAKWDGARIKIVSGSDGSVDTAIRVYHVNVSLVYSTAPSGSTDDSGTLGSLASTMNAGAAMVIAESAQGAAIGYRLKEQSARRPKIWLPMRRLVLPSTSLQKAA